MSVAIGKYGRIVLPKKLRDKYNVKEGSRLIIREYKDQIILIPVTTYEKPTQALHGSIEVDRPIKEPKETARTYIRRRLIEEQEKTDRTTPVRKFLAKAIAKRKLEKALTLYRDGKITLWKAAKIADLSLWEIMEITKKRKIPFHYTPEDFHKDFEKAMNEK